jgi:DNA-binding response OmpR family regulator
VKKILVVEDEKLLSEMYSRKLSEAGFQTFVAGNAVDAFAVSLKEKPDLIVLDILLPGENGLSFLKKLRSHPDIGNTKVVIFSNLDNPETKSQAQELGVESYLIKTDFTPQQMIEEIKKYL